MDTFTFALREHMRTRGEMRGYFGGESLYFHTRGGGCSGWVIPDGVKALPDYDYQFAGTDVDAQAVHVIRLDTPLSCECGGYRDKIVQIEGTFHDLLTQLLKIDVPSQVTF